MLRNGLDMAARAFGFCRWIAANNVDPDRGKPEMKWMRKLDYPYAGTNCSLLVRCQLERSIERSQVGGSGDVLANRTYRSTQLSSCGTN